MKYCNLDLDVSGYHREGDVEQFRVRVSDSPAGEQSRDERVTVPSDLRQRLSSLAGGFQ